MIRAASACAVLVLALAVASPVLAAAPANNDFAGLTLTGAAPAFTGTNADATSEDGEDDHAAASRDDDCDDDPECLRSVWWSWMAPASGTVNVNLCRSDYDTTLAVYTGDGVGSLTEVASNDDIDPTEDDDEEGDSSETTTPLNCPANRKASGVEFQAVAGTTYRIAVAGYAGATGAIAGTVGSGPLGQLPPNPGRCSNRSLGSGGKDDLTGTAFGDIIGALDGNDRLRGGRGDDCLYGDRGKDRIDGGAGRDRVFGNSGNDRVAGGSGNDRVGGNRGNDRVSGGGGNDQVSGDSGNDAISVRDGRRDRVDCGRGRDRVTADRRDRLRRCERVRRR